MQTSIATIPARPTDGRILAKDLHRGGYGEDILSVIPPPPLGKLSPSSEIKADSMGKAPGRRNVNGEWAGAASWNEHRTTLEEAREMDQARANVGLKARRFPAFDVDVTNARMAKIVGEVICQRYPNMARRVGSAPKALFPFRLAAGAAPFKKIVLSFVAGDKQKIEVLGDGQQYVISGYHPGTRQPYRWPQGCPTADSLPEIDEAGARELLEAIRKALEAAGADCEPVAGGGARADRSSVNQDSLKASDLDQLRRAVEAIPNRQEDGRKLYVDMCYAIKAAGGDRDVWMHWAAKWEGGNDPEYDLRTWETARPPFGIGAEWIYSEARKHGFDNAAEEFSAIPGAAAPEVGRKQPDWRTPSGLAQSTWPSIRRADLGSRPILAHLNDLVYQNDSGNAERFKVVCGGEVRYCAEQKSWLVYEGRRWAWDDGPLVGEKAEDAMRYFHWEASRGIDSRERLMEFARVSLEGGRMRNMISQARGKLPIRLDMLDQGDYLLNFTNGTLDLRTLELRPHRAEDFITKMLPFEYSASARCDTFRRVVMEAFAGDMDLFRYFQEALGYSLTGDTREKAAFYCHGPSGGGKSTVLDAVRRAMGGYAATVPATALTVKPGYESSTDLTALARLVGARYAYSDEPEEGEALNESQFKVLVPNGRGVMNTRRLFRDSVESRVTHKHWIGANYLLNTKSGKGVHERLRMIPFTNAVPPERQEEGLPERLDLEWAGIIAFMVEGAHSWYRRGRLLSPRVVEEEGLQYKKSQEPAEAWRASCLELVAGIKTSSQELQASFDRFRRRTGKPPLTPKKLAEQYTAWGLKSQRMTGGASGWSGVRILGEFGEEAGPATADVAEIL